MKKPWTDKKPENMDPQNPRPKKSLGQNFLKSDKALRDIRDAADPSADDIILEIGPGLGALTETLLPFPAKIIAIEKDDTLSLILEEKFRDEIRVGKLEILNRDILEFDPEVLRTYETSVIPDLIRDPGLVYKKNNKQSNVVIPLDSGSEAGMTPAVSTGNISRYKIVANIPYNITGAIIRKFLECSYQPQMMVLLIQKEVAERICSRGEKTGKESLLSICVKAYGNPSYVATVKAGSFHPVPRVDSAVLKIDNISKDRFTNIEHEDLFFTLVKLGFAHPRKILISNLSESFERETLLQIFTQLHIPEKSRSEDLSIEHWSNLVQLVYNDVYGSAAK
jgi:16S rRNA (adenine1518-N6/adenine1519-N6)-dimethyltransferase